VSGSSRLPKKERGNNSGTKDTIIIRREEKKIRCWAVICQEAFSLSGGMSPMVVRFGFKVKNLNVGVCDRKGEPRVSEKNQ